MSRALRTAKAENALRRLLRSEGQALLDDLAEIVIAQYSAPERKDIALVLRHQAGTAGEPDEESVAVAISVWGKLPEKIRVRLQALLRSLVLLGDSQGDDLVVLGGPSLTK